MAHSSLIFNIKSAVGKPQPAPLKWCRSMVPGLRSSVREEKAVASTSKNEDPAPHLMRSDASDRRTKTRHQRRRPKTAPEEYKEHIAFAQPALQHLPGQVIWISR
jgi:hypothetical protein